MSFKNSQGVTGFSVQGKYHAYCPMGHAWYSGRLRISADNPGMIPDYCEVDKHISTLNGKEIIIEDAVADVFSFVADQIQSGFLYVTCSVDDAAHSPVTVTKSSQVVAGEEYYQ